MTTRLTLRLPNPAPLARLLRRTLPQAARAATKGQPTRPWETPLAEALAPLLARWMEQSYQRSRQRLLTRLPRRRKSLQWAFDLFNPLVAKAAENAALALAQSTLATMTQQVQTGLQAIRLGLAQGLELGETTQQLTARVMREVADPMRAVRIATTESSRAVHAGQWLAAKQTAAETGLNIRKRWLVSSDACPKCRALSGKTVDLDQPFWVDPRGGVYAVISHPPLHPHCVLPETPIWPTVGVAWIESRYNGTVITVDLGVGSKVTVTANHLFLTRNGFLPASSLMEGDDVVYYHGRKRMNGTYPDNDGKPAFAEKVVHAASKAFGVRTRCVPVASEYLHGDGAFCNGDIRVISSNGLLGYHCDTTFSKPLDHLGFGNRFNDPAFLDSLGVSSATLLALRNATDGGMGGLRDAKAVFAASLRKTNPFCLHNVAARNMLLAKNAANYTARDIESQRESEFRLSSKVATSDFWTWQVNGSSISNFDADFSQTIPDSVGMDADRLGDVLDRFSSEVSLRKIVSVRRKHYNGPVYDVTNPWSLNILGSGIVTSNCMCALTEVIE